MMILWIIIIVHKVFVGENAIVIIFKTNYINTFSKIVERITDN